jgi:hypothetical protein
MAALDTDRNTKRLAGSTKFVFPCGVDILYSGGMVGRNATGYAVAASSALSQRVVGVAMETVDNSGGSAGDENVAVERGCFWFGNSADGDAITIAEIGEDCFVVDDQTVAKTAGTAGTRQVAGRIVGVDSTLGVCVEISGDADVSGAFTPTFTAGTNTTAGGSMVGLFAKKGSVVEFSIRGSITHTAGAPTASTFEVSLPIASDLAAAGDVIATVTGANVTVGHGTANTTDNRIVANYSIGATGAQVVTITGHYLLK